jgi:peroxiredoxin Q/BCP
MVELRKRKTPPPAPVRPAKKKTEPKPKTTKSKGKVVKAVEAMTESVTERVEAATEAITEAVSGKSNGAKDGPPAVGDTIDLAGFGDEIETNDGVKTTLAKLVEESKSGVVLFTYPKASTPGCTTQACLFRDAYEPLTSTGLSIYGLSTDSPKANTAFKTKQSLPYPLLCNPSGSLIKAIGMAKAPKGTKRGVFVVDKSGKVLAAEGGGPQATVEVVKKIVDEAGSAAPSAPAATETEGEATTSKDEEMAKTADEVADTAEKLDGEKA